jgi:hypothetical protein
MKITILLILTILATAFAVASLSTFMIGCGAEEEDTGPLEYEDAPNTVSIRFENELHPTADAGIGPGIQGSQNWSEN